MNDAFKPTHNDDLELAVSSLRRALESLIREIGDYPTPISGCDSQFNHLLSERSKIEAALRVLDRQVFISTPRQPNPGDQIESR